MGENEKILFIVQGTRGNEANIAHYMLYGRVAPSQGSVFEFTDGVRQNEYANVEKTFGEMARYIEEEGFGYLWVYRTDDQFTEEAGRILRAQIEESGFYRVVRDGGGITLRRIGSY